VPAVEIDGNDIAHIVFTPVLPDGSRIVQYSYWTGNGFSSPQNISVATLLHYPALHERGNNIYSVWQVGGYEGGSSINYNSRISGTWQGEYAIPSSSGSTYCDVAASYYQDKIHYVWDASGDIYIETLTGPGSIPATWRIVGTGDFNNDAERDILWRYYGPEGYNVVWYMGYSGSIGIQAGLQSPEKSSLQSALGKPEGQQIQAELQGRDHRETQAPARVFDILRGKKPLEVYRDALEVGELINGGDRETIEMRFPAGERSLTDPREITGEETVRIQLMNYLGQDMVRAVTNPSWEIAGTGDFNGDGKPDIVWRYYGPEGYNVIWYMDGVNYLGQDLIRAVTNTNWRIAGTGDFNGDGKPDIVWRYYGPEGYNVIWYMNGPTYLGQDLLPAVP
jgi:hypothetical protein